MAAPRKPTTGQSRLARWWRRLWPAADAQTTPSDVPDAPPGRDASSDPAPEVNRDDDDQPPPAPTMPLAEPPAPPAPRAPAIPEQRRRAERPAAPAPTPAPTAAVKAPHDEVDAARPALRTRPPAKRDTGVRSISLALQGGGSHGAFTWGVLDRLLEEAWIDIAAVSGASAGAMNAAVLATGLARGGREGARAALRAFWQDISRAGAMLSPLSMPPQEGGPGSFARSGLEWAGTLLRTLSPYEFNPLNLNPLRDIAHRHVDAAAMNGDAPRLFITATAVHTGQARVFTGPDVDVQVLMASACLPFLFQAVEIDGEPYWDGGYTGNPALHPLLEHAPQRDLLLVRINPLHRAGTPRRSHDIMDRVSEITFNAGLLGELRALAAWTTWLRADAGRVGDPRLPRLHMIADDEGLAPYVGSSKLHTGFEFLEQLHRLGRAAAARFLEQHGADVGRRGSLDIEADILRTVKPSAADRKPERAPRRRA